MCASLWKKSPVKEDETYDIEVDRFFQILCNAYKIKGSSLTRFCLTYSLTAVIYDGTGTLVII